MSAPGRKGETVWALTGRRFLKHRLAVFSLGVLAALALAALSACWRPWPWRRCRRLWSPP